MVVLDAGADCITTCSYQATVKGFLEAALVESDAGARAIMKRSIDLAAEARAQFIMTTKRKFGPFILASIASYGSFPVTNHVPFLLARKRMPSFELEGLFLSG